MAEEEKPATDNSRIKKYAAIFASLFTVYAGIISTTGVDSDNIIKISGIMILGTVAVFMLEYFFKSGDPRVKKYLSTSFVCVLVLFLLWNILALMFPASSIFKPYFDNVLGSEQPVTPPEPEEDEVIKIIGTVACAGSSQSEVRVSIDSENYTGKTDIDGKFSFELKNKTPDTKRTLVFNLEKKPDSPSQEFTKEISLGEEVYVNFEYCQKKEVKKKTVRAKGKIAVRYADNFEANLTLKSSESKDIELSDENPEFDISIQVLENESVTVYCEVTEPEGYTFEKSPFLLDNTDTNIVIQFKKKRDLYALRMKQAKREIDRGEYANALEILDLMMKNNLHYSQRSEHDILLLSAITAEKADQLTASIKTFQRIEELDYFVNFKPSTKRNYWGERLDVMMKICDYFKLKSPEYEMAEKILEDDEIRGHWSRFAHDFNKYNKISGSYFLNFEKKNNILKQIRKIKEITGRT